VIGGIMLGPSLFGAYIPGFEAHVFPKASIPNLTLIANIGLILYLFIGKAPIKVEGERRK
jgi:Kef-type K+ transport system membrane component KefB